MKKLLSLILLGTLLICSSACTNNSNSNKSLTNYEELNQDINSNEVINVLKVIIDDKEYSLTLENNKTVQRLITMLPLELDMNELNGNEKYYYLDTTLPTDEYNPQTINSGDVMLYGNNCLVIFYKSFSTPYSYTKIGHIDNLSDLGTKNIKVKFIK